MAEILNIDTTSKHCSVALAKDGEVVMGFESSEEMDHSVSLAPFVDKCLGYLRERQEVLDAVSVSAGPGSYTGLRIGLSMAKGLAFGMDVPLIMLSSLEILAVRAIFTYPEFTGEEIIIPMIDARRMEVFTAAYDSGLNLIKAQQPMVLDEISFADLDENKTKLVIGDGSEKFKTLFKAKNVVWLGDGMPHAKYMTALSEKYFRENKFADIAYSVPNYLKEYQATTPKTPVHLRGKNKEK